MAKRRRGAASERADAIMDILGDGGLSSVDMPDVEGRTALAAAEAAGMSYGRTGPRSPSAETAAFLSAGRTESDASAANPGAGRLMNRVVNDLGLDLGRRATREETHALLGAMLMAPSSALDRVASDPEAPAAARIVARRLLDDARTGDTSALERVWDRVFGKPGEAQADSRSGSMSISLPGGARISLSQSVSAAAYREMMAGVIEDAEEAGEGRQP